MPKQRLEGILSKSLKARNDCWYLKLQSNKLSHQAMPADFILLLNNYKFRYLIECKETVKNRFVFSRLTQLDSLNMFDRASAYNSSWVMLLFWKGRLKKSKTYMINITYFNEIMKKNKYKSLSIEECEHWMNNNPIKMLEIEVGKNNLFNLDKILKMKSD